MILSITIAVGTALQHFHWISKPAASLGSTATTRLHYALSLTYFLTHHSTRLAVICEQENPNNTSALAHLADERAQWKLTTNSIIPTTGKPTTAQCVISAVANLVGFLTHVINSPHTPRAQPLLVTKLVAYISILTSRAGRVWLETHKRSRFLPLQLFAEIQTILQIFTHVGQEMPPSPNCSCPPIHTTQTPLRLNHRNTSTCRQHQQPGPLLPKPHHNRSLVPTPHEPRPDPSEETTV